LKIDIYNNYIKMINEVVYRSYILKLIKNEDDDKMCSLLKNIYKKIKEMKYSYNDQCYWLKIILFNEFVNYILSNRLLEKFEFQIKKYYHINIMALSSPVPLYKK
jgi:hypothetical protein